MAAKRREYIKGLRGEAGVQLVERPDKASEREARERERGRKLLTVWLAVGAVMAVVVVLWSLMLPTQLARFSGFHPLSVFSNGDQRPAQPGLAETWQAAVGRAERAMDDLSDSLDGPGDAAVAATTAGASAGSQEASRAAAIRARLEASLGGSSAPSTAAASSDDDDNAHNDAPAPQEAAPLPQ
jgi:hypothetical protein